jgi:hypothetical protein
MQGEARAWELLAGCDPRVVTERAAVKWSSERGAYTLAVFGLPVVVDPVARTMTASGAEGEWILTKAAYFSRLSILHYLVGVRSVPPAGRLVKPAELKAGQFFQGSHELPLERIAARFRTDKEGFVRQAIGFGGELQSYGDAAAELRPLPRVPVTLILWEEDEEFPARCDLLFDASCEQQLPTDILWSVAMMCGLAMLSGS